MDSARVRQAGQVAGQSSTRRLGDYRAKLNYNDIDLLRYSLHTRAHAPVSCVCGCIRVARGCCLCAVLSASSWAAMFAARVLDRGCAEHPAALMGGAVVLQGTLVQRGAVQFAYSSLGLIYS